MRGYSGLGHRMTVKAEGRRGVFSLLLFLLPRAARAYQITSLRTSRFRLRNPYSWPLSNTHCMNTLSP
jgi:hypothetical protein